MAGSWIPGAISGLGSIIGSISSQGDQQDTAQLNYEYGERAADNAQRRAWQTYEKYQSPEALRKQYEKAGLNPMALAGNGTGGSVGQGQQGTGAGAQQGSSKAAIMQARTQAISGALNNMLMQKQGELIDSERKKNEAETNNINQTTPGEVSEIQARINNLKASTNFYAFQEANEWLKTEILQGQLHLNEQQVKQDLMKIQQQDKLILLKDAEVEIANKLADSQIKVNSAHAAKALQDVAESMARTLNIKADTFIKEIQGKVDNEFAMTIAMLSTWSLMGDAAQGRIALENISRIINELGLTNMAEGVKEIFGIGQEAVGKGLKKLLPNIR